MVRLTVERTRGGAATLVAHLVAIGMTSAAAAAASAIAPDLRVGAGGASRAQINALIRQLSDEQAIAEGVQLSFRSERMNEIALMGAVAEGVDLFNPGSTPKIPMRVAGYLMRPIVLSDTASLADHLQQIMTACTAPDWPAAHSRMPTAFRDLIDGHSNVHMIAKVLLPSLERAAERDYHTRADCRLAAVALAARLYEIDHDGRMPAALTDLVPTYLPAVPTDPLSGKPLLYKTDPPRVYSVGDDGVDHGGVPVDRHAKDAFHREHGDIVVYLKTEPRKSTSTTKP
jgi:hypothetical protein